MFCLLLIIFFPNPIKIFIYKYIYGWKIEKNVRIGLSFIDAEKVILKRNVRIGHFNTIKQLKRFEIGENSSLMNHNRFINGKEKWDNAFIVGENCGITSRHLFDSGGGIYIGNDVIIAGAATQIWSHEVRKGTIPRPVYIGSNIYIGASVLIAPGANIPSNSIVGLGTVVPSKLVAEEGSLIVGNPAQTKKRKS